MRLITLAGAATLAFAAGAEAAPAFQPPMNSIQDAYYTCSGGAFLVSYDAAAPTTATVTTSNNNRSYTLKRTPVGSGAKFVGGGVTFWTDGSQVVVTGTEKPYSGCKLKPA